jgi:hypothetical protein
MGSRDPVDEPAAKEKAEAWRREHEAELAWRTEDAAKARDEKAEAWRRDHEAELDRRAEQRRADREARRDANAAAHQARVEAEAAATAASRDARRGRKEAEWTKRSDPLNDPFTVSQAARLGISPQAFLALQAERQERMRNTPSIAEQMKTVPVVGGRLEQSQREN